MRTQTATVHHTDCLTWMAAQPDSCIDCCVTSPPYWGQRQYGADEEHGREESDEQYLETQSRVFREVQRLLKPTGTLWVVIGDTYYSRTRENRNNANAGLDAGTVRGGGEFRLYRTSDLLQERSLAGIPWRLALRLMADGWILRSDIIWRKTNPQPDPARRPAKGHEHVFLFVKHASEYHYEGPQGEPDVWDVYNGSESTWHRATFPLVLVRRCIARGCVPGGLVYDPYAGAGTTLRAALLEQCSAIGTELSEDYARRAEAETREAATQGRLF